MIFNWAKQTLTLLFRRPIRHQVAALCYREGTQGKEVLLITTRGGGRWILPKGWPMIDRSDGESALQEAFEEAGVHGEVETPAIGSFVSKKKLRKDFSISIKTDVYAIKVSHQDREFPEAGQRELAWLTIDAAMQRIQSDGISYVLKKWSTTI